MFHRVRRHHTFMIDFSGAVLRGLARPILVYLFFLTGTLILLDAFAFWWIEGGTNPSMKSWYDALYFTVTTLTGVGFGDIVPVTHIGKALAMLTMLGGTALFVAYTAILASSILEIEFRMPERAAGRRSDAN